MIRNHSESGLLGSEFRLPFGELLGGDFTGLFRINLRVVLHQKAGEIRDQRYQYAMKHFYHEKLKSFVEA